MVIAKENPEDVQYRNGFYVVHIVGEQDFADYFRLSRCTWVQETLKINMDHEEGNLVGV